MQLRGLGDHGIGKYTQSGGYISRNPKQETDGTWDVGHLSAGGWLL